MAKAGKLTPQQEVFCQQFVILQFHGAQAAIAAKYSKKTADQSASRLLSQVKIQKRIAQLLKAACKKFDNQKEELINEMRLIAFSDIRNYLDVDEGGSITVKPFDQMPENATRVIKKIREKRVIRESKDGSESQIMESTLDFELWSKEKAIHMLGLYENMFSDKITGQGRSGPDLSGYTDEELDEMESDL